MKALGNGGPGWGAMWAEEQPVRKHAGVHGCTDGRGLDGFWGGAGGGGVTSQKTVWGRDVNGGPTDGRSLRARRQSLRGEG